MLTSRWRPVVYSAIAVVVVWTLALTGRSIARNSRMTADKVRAYVDSVNLSKLSAADRSSALKKLAEKYNALPIDERRRAQLERVAKGWFDQMTEEEQGRFLEATMPAGFKQMLTSFQQLPEEKRRQTIADALRRLRDTVTRMQADDSGAQIALRPPQASGELLAKVRTMGLEGFYTQSTAQVRADLAPVLEELQRVMESGRPFRGR
jgi:hypothetical protein